MSDAEKLRALVVDDESGVRRVLIRALEQQGFQCDWAADGNAAEERAAHVQYDAVVTDLRMPYTNGHALAMHLVTLKPRPVVVVHTGVIEPKIVKDLLARGVDDVLFKPCNLGLLAVKVKGIVERRSAEYSRIEPLLANTPDEMPAATDEEK